ncbi:unnamed protein product [Brassica rapa subsp. narinosa]
MKKREELPVCKEGDLTMDQLVELTSKGYPISIGSINRKPRTIGPETMAVEAMKKM